MLDHRSEPVHRLVGQSEEVLWSRHRKKIERRHRLGLARLAVERFLEGVARAGSARPAECLDERLHRARRLARRKPDEPLLQPEFHEITVEDAGEFARSLETYMAHSRGRAPSQSMLFTYTSAVQSFFAFLRRERLRRDLEELRERLRRRRGRRGKRLPRVPPTRTSDGGCPQVRY